MSDLPQCAWCGLPIQPVEEVDSYDHGPDGPVPVKLHDTCLDDWANRTDPMTGRAQ